jgi:hypothetical protein
LAISFVANPGPNLVPADANKSFKMPGCMLHLVSLSPHTTISGFLSRLQSHQDVQVLLASKVIRWVILPTKLSVQELLHPKNPYDLFIITMGTTVAPAAIFEETACHWSIPAGIPSRLTTDFASKNDQLLHPAEKLPLTGALDKPRISKDSQDLSLSEDLRIWVEQFSKGPGRGAVTMLNLLAFAEGKKESYLTYGKAFAETIGATRGGNAKFVGNVIGKQDGWDEIAVAHYPSILHFADMLASEDYQEVNQKFRVPALKDTCILCTSEIALEDMGIKALSMREVVSEVQNVKPKL